MNTSKKIGRIALLKYCFFSVAIVLAVTAIIGLFYEVFTDEPISVLTFFENMLKDAVGDGIFLLIPVVVILMGILHAHRQGWGLGNRRQELGIGS